MAVDGRLADLIAVLGDDHRRLGAEPVAQALEQVLAEIVVLIEHGDLGVGLGSEDVFGIDATFGLIGRLPAHGPGEVRGIAKAGGAGGGE